MTARARKKSEFAPVAVPDRLSSDVRHLHSAYWNHARYCDLRVSAECAMPVACEHGRDVCPICDKCTCANPPKESR